MNSSITNKNTPQRIHFSLVARQLGISIQELMNLEQTGKILAPEAYHRGDGRYYTETELNKIIDLIGNQKKQESRPINLTSFIFAVFFLFIYLAYHLIKNNSIEEQKPTNDSIKKESDNTSHNLPIGPKPKWLLPSPTPTKINQKISIQSEKSIKTLEEQKKKGVLL